MKSKSRSQCESAIVKLTHAEKRLKVLPILLEEKSYAEILRETNVIAELSLEGILNHVGLLEEDVVEQPLIRTLEDSIKTMPPLIQQNFKRIAKVSGTIQKQHRRLNGSKSTTRKEASDAMGWGGFMVKMAQGVIKEIDD